MLMLPLHNHHHGYFSRYHLRILFSLRNLQQFTTHYSHNNHHNNINSNIHHSIINHRHIYQIIMAARAVQPIS